MTNFKSLPELLDYFKDEETCRIYLEKTRWAGVTICPYCDHSGKMYLIEKGRRFKCGNKECHKKFSVTVGTVFENTKIKLRLWIAAIYLITAHKKGISSLQLSRDLNITQKTAWFMLHRIREMVTAKTPHILNTIVQADETFMGGKNKNRHYNKRVPESQGRAVKDKTPVLGIIEVGGKVNTRVIADTKASTIRPIIEKIVTSGAIMVTDEWKGYRGLGSNYSHIVVNHGHGEYVRGAFHTNNIENFWSLLKRGVYGIYHQVSRKHLQRYCEEFAYRFNTRDLNDGSRFNSALTNTDGRLKYKDLIRKL